MIENRQENKALMRAAEAAGGIAALAAKLGLHRQSVHQWKRVPPQYVLAIEAASGGTVTRYQLRPDIYGRTEPCRA